MISATTGTTGWPRERALLGCPTSSITRARTTTSRPRCARRLGRAARLDLLPADGDGRLPAAGVHRRCDRRPALPVLDPHRHVGKLGWFDRWFASPSNHRVHHAVNDRYIDRNYGGIFMPWDRMFGTFVEEDEKCVYGTRAPLDSWDPLWANLEVYADLARKSWRAPAGVTSSRSGSCRPAGNPPRPRAPLAEAAVRRGQVRRFDPPMSRGTRGFAAAH